MMLNRILVITIIILVTLFGGSLWLLHLERNRVTELQSDVAGKNRVLQEMAEKTKIAQKKMDEAVVAISKMEPDIRLVTKVKTEIRTVRGDCEKSFAVAMKNRREIKWRN